MNRTQQSSFPRKRESSAARLRGKSLTAVQTEMPFDSYALWTQRSWIPAFAGMTMFINSCCAKR